MIHRLNYKKERTPMVKQNYHRRYFYKKEENICKVLFPLPKYDSVNRINLQKSKVQHDSMNRK